MIAPDHEQHAHHSRPEHRLELKLDVEARSHLRPHFLCQRGRAIEVPHARIIVIAVKDPAIASVAEHLRGHLSKGSIVLHTAGGLGTAIMEAYHQRLFAHGGRLYVGGLFAGLGGVVSQSLIAHDGEGWIAMGDTSGLGLAGAASELAVGDPECGLYTLNLPASSTSDGAVHRLGADGWRALAGERPAGVICSQLAVSAAGDVYLGCQTPFESRPLTPPMPRLYRHDGDRWVPLDFIPDVTEGTLVDMVFDPEGRLWIVGGLNDGFIAQWDGARFTRVERFDGMVSHIAFEPGGGGRFVVGGSFTHVGAIAVARIALWDGTSWQPLGAGLDTPPGALAYGPDAIYVSSSPGDSTTGPHVEWVLGRWNGTTWEELGVPERGLPPHVGHERGSRHQIHAIHVTERHLVLAGGIYPETASAASGGRNVFIFDGERFEPLAGGVGAISVEALVAQPDALFFGGFVATTGGGETLAPSIGVARFALGSRP